MTILDNYPDVKPLELPPIPEIKASLRKAVDANALMAQKVVERSPSFGGLVSCEYRSTDYGGAPCAVGYLMDDDLAAVLWNEGYNSDTSALELLQLGIIRSSVEASLFLQDLQNGHDAWAGGDGAASFLMMIDHPDPKSVPNYN